MYLKRLYHQDKLVRDKEGKVVEVKDGAVAGVKVLRAGPRQHFSPSFIEKAAMEGWLAMADGKVTIKGQDGDVVYKIERTPGYYCCHCQKPVGDGAAGKIHVEGDHIKAKSPDEGNPVGYRKDNFYDCVKQPDVRGQKSVVG